MSAKLRAMDLEILPLSPYNRAYLKKHVHYLDYMMQLYGLILEDALKLKPGFKSMCDYGAGTGLLGLLAKACFSCELTYVDIYPEACRDVKIIAQALDLTVDHVVEGDTEKWIALNPSQPEVLLSFDVVEHIYDLKSFFELTRTNFPAMVHVHNTSANVYNLFKRGYFRQIHRQCEYEGDPLNLKETDHQEPFFQLRYDWIRSHYHSINQDAVHAMAMITRGLTFEDMESFVFLWLDGQRHEDPYRDKYPHNTCDPFNGNWAERLLYFSEYEKFAEGYQAGFIGNPYNVYRKETGRNFIAKGLNMLIRLSGNTGKYIWPSFNLLLKPKA